MRSACYRLRTLVSCTSIMSSSLSANSRLSWYCRRLATSPRTLIVATSRAAYSVIAVLEKETAWCIPWVTLPFVLRRKAHERSSHRHRWPRQALCPTFTAVGSPPSCRSSKCSSFFFFSTRLRQSAAMEGGSSRPSTAESAVASSPDLSGRATFENLGITHGHGCFVPLGNVDVDLGFRRAWRRIFCW